MFKGLFNKGIKRRKLKRKKKDEVLYKYEALKDEMNDDHPGVVSQADALKRRLAYKESDDSDKSEIVELCEEIIETSKELEEKKAEYKRLTSYLNDIETIENLEKDKKKDLSETASLILSLDSDRDEYLKTEKTISDTQYEQMLEEDSQIPKVIKRLKENERYLNSINKDMKHLEGEKLQWIIHKKSCKKEREVIRKLSYILLLLFGTIEIFLSMLKLGFKVEDELMIVFFAFLAAVAGAYLFIKYDELGKEIRKADACINKAITLLNHVKIKYVNTKNAVDYTAEKYHVRGSVELTDIYEKYQDIARKKEKLKQTSDDLAYYSSKLIRQLESLELYDAAVWTHHTDALTDKREMVELKHDLVVRRKKIRSAMEKDTKAIEDLKYKINRKSEGLSQSSKHVNEILERIDRLTCQNV